MYVQGVADSDCLSPKTTAWNEFSSIMASAIICLATAQKFNFSKRIFDSMIRNLDNVSGNFLMYPRKPKRKDTQVPQPSGPTDNVADEAAHKELGDRLVRAATTASSLEAEQDSGNITKTQSKATPNESSSQGTNSGGGPRCYETMGDTTAQTRFESVFKHFNDLLLARDNTLRSDEDSLKFNELMELCTNLQNRVLDLEKTKTSQRNEIDSLKKRVKKLEQRKRSRTYKLKRFNKVGLTDRVESFGYEESLDDLGGEEVFVSEQEVFSTAATTETITTKEITLAQALKALKTLKPKAKGIVFHDPEQPVKPKKKDQIRLDEEAALKLQAKFDEEERLTRERAKKEQEANIALIETWDDIQVKIDVDHQLAKRLQAQEQAELSDAEKATLFQKLLEKRRKAGEELVQESTKKQKVDDNKETSELKHFMGIVPEEEEEVAIDAIPLAVKSSRIVDWKIHKEGKKSHY
nr:hypothetical protein [Tanacetum cinerariifolium]